MKKHFLFLVAIISCSIAQAQYYYLPFLNAGGNPAGLNVDDEYPVGGGLSATWTSIMTSSANPAWSTSQSIPFSFNFNGSPVTDYKVSTTGILTFDVASALPAPSSTSALLPSALIPDNSVCVWGLVGSGANDNIVVKTFGTAPNRQYWIFFSSYSIPGNTSGWTYWSIVLEETTDNIYLVDQRTNGTLAMSLGIQINSTTAYSVLGSPTITTETLNDATPDDNSFYQFMYGAQPANEAAMSVLTIEQFHVVPAVVGITGEFVNLGSDPITTIDIKYEVDGASYTDTKVGLNVAFGQTYSFSHYTPYNLTLPTSFPLNVWVELAGDNNGLNDSLPGIVSGLSFLPDKKVVFEEATGTWCGWCPRGTVFMDSLAGLYPDDALLVAVHNADPMANTTYDNGMGALIGGYPSGLVDRKDVDVDPSQFIDLYAERITDVAPCNVSVDAIYNSGNSTIDIEVSATFATDLDGSYRFNAVVVEDDVTGTGGSYAQVNYYSYETLDLPLVGAGHNWQAETDPIPASEMEYDHVGRAILGGFDGTASSIPSSITANSTYTKSYTYTIPATYDETAIHVIGWVSDFSTGRILNAAKDYLFTSISESPTGSFQVSVNPNPVINASVLTIELKTNSNVTIEIVDALGNTVQQPHQQKVAAGSYNFNIGKLPLASGFYFVKVTANGEAITQKIVVAR